MIAIYPRKMLPAVNAVGSTYAARRGRRSGERGSMSRSLIFMLGSLSGPPRCDNGRPSLNTLAGANPDLPLRSEKHVHARAELDQADALATRHLIARLLPEDN